MSETLEGFDSCFQRSAVTLTEQTESIKMWLQPEVKNSQHRVLQHPLDVSGNDPAVPRTRLLTLVTPCSSKIIDFTVHASHMLLALSTYIS